MPFSRITIYDFPELVDEVRPAIGPHEREADVAAMIGLAAHERAYLRNKQPSESDFRFAAAILCFLLDGLKRPGYRDRVRQWRAEFEGISEYSGASVKFLWSINPKALRADDVLYVLNRRFESSFSIRVWDVYPHRNAPRAEYPTAEAEDVRDYGEEEPA